MELRVDLQDFQFNEVHARYFRFFIGDEMQNYTLNVAGYDPSSDAGMYPFKKLETCWNIIQVLPFDYTHQVFMLSLV